MGRRCAGESPAPTRVLALPICLGVLVSAFALEADFYLAASPEGVEVEEGFITFNTLPAGLLLKAGKMRAEFGKVNRMHTHVLPEADRPLVTQNLVGGEEGISLPGVSLSKLIQNPAFFLEATGEAYYGFSDVFASREDESFAAKVTAALRHEFGGHAVKAADR